MAEAVPVVIPGGRERFLSCPQRVQLVEVRPMSVTSVGPAHVSLVHLGADGLGGACLVVPADIEATTLASILGYGRQLYAQGRQEGIDELMRVSRRAGPRLLPPSRR